MVDLVWSPVVVRIGKPAPFWLRTGRAPPLPIITAAKEHITQWIRLCVMRGYNGLELVVYGAVELGDVMLFFIGEQGLFGLEVYTRLVGQTY